MNEEKDEKLLIEIKSSNLKIYDTLTVLISAIASDTILPSSLIAPIEILQKELMENVVYKIDKYLNI